MSAAPSWDPAQYDRFKAERDRPALDLLVRLPGDLNPRSIWDLGCGTGEHAALLARRHPAAEVIGVDLSPAMLAEARARPEPVTWIEADLAAWAQVQAGPVDLIFSNAALQWMDGHERLVPHLLGLLSPGGVLACQMPQSYEGPGHAAVRAVAADGPWSDSLAEVAGVRPLASPSDYAQWCRQAGAEADLWSTTYFHALNGPDPVFEWMKGTGLRPYLDRVRGPHEEAFIAACKAALRAAFPPGPDGGVLMPFSRLFLVARRD